MENIVLERIWKRGGTLYVECIDGNLYTGEEQAHTFRITGQDEHGTVTPITGTITGKFLRADNLDVPLVGSLDGGVAVLTLTEQCYDCRGRYVLSIFADDGEHKICIYCGTGNVFRTDGEATIDPGNIIQDVSDLIDRIQTAIGQIPADYSALTARVTQTETDVSDLKSAISKEDWNLITKATLHKNKFFDTEGNLVTNYTVDAYEFNVSGGVQYYFNSDKYAVDNGSTGYNNQYSARGLAWYDSNNTIINADFRLTKRSPIISPANAVKCIVCFAYATGASDAGDAFFTDRALTDHKNNITFGGDVLGKAIKNPRSSNIRRACINFQFDDGSANDATIVSIFKALGYRCGFALLSTVSAADVTRYLGYQADGFEILSHSTDGTAMQDATVPAADIDAKLKTSYQVLTGYGFDIRGWVTPNSIMLQKYKPCLRKYYQYATTVMGGTYSGTGRPYQYASDGVFNLKRISLQSTTLANQKAAVDATIANGGCLTFYGHAAAIDTTDNLTTANLNSLLSYIYGLEFNSGEKYIYAPSDAIINYFSAKNDDTANWITVTADEAGLSADDYTVNYWDMRYNRGLGLFSFEIRISPKVDKSGVITDIFNCPVYVPAGVIVANESGRIAMLYDQKLRLNGSGTWTAGTYYRFSGMCPIMPE